MDVRATDKRAPGSLDRADLDMLRERAVQSAPWMNRSNEHLILEYYHVGEHVSCITHMPRGDVYGHNLLENFVEQVGALAARRRKIATFRTMGQVFDAFTLEDIKLFIQANTSCRTVIFLARQRLDRQMLSDFHELVARRRESGEDMLSEPAARKIVQELMVERHGAPPEKEDGDRTGNWVVYDGATGKLTRRKPFHSLKAACTEARRVGGKVWKTEKEECLV